MLRTSIIALGVAGCLAGTAQAGPCGNEAAELAHSLGMSTDIPQAGNDPLLPPSAAPGAEQSSPLAKSGGVIAPPDVGRTPTVTPPDVDSDMPTAPQAMPREPAPAPQSGGLSPESRQQVAALLTAARQEDQAGREQPCRERLVEAKKLMDQAG